MLSSLVLVTTLLRGLPLPVEQIRTVTEKGVRVLLCNNTGGSTLARVQSKEIARVGGAGISRWRLICVLSLL